MKRFKLVWLLAGVVMLNGLAGCYAPAFTPGGETAVPPAPTYTAVPSGIVAGTAEPATQAPPAATEPALNATATFVMTATRTFTAATLVPAAPVATQEVSVTNGAPIPAPFDPVVQQAVAQSQADLARRLGIESSQVEVVEVRSVVWPDGGLGCPQPGMAYIQVQVDGLLIRLQAGDRVYEYHSGGTRAPFLCQQGQ